MSSSEYERSLREEDLRRFVSPGFLGLFDQQFYEEFGRWPNSTPPPAARRPVNDARRQAIQNLIDRGATEGERSAAQAAMERLDAAAGSHSANMGRLDAEAESFGSYG